MDYSVITVLGGLITMCVAVWKIARDFRNDMQETQDLLFNRFDTHKDKVDERLMIQVKLDSDAYMKKESCDLTQKIHAHELTAIKEEIGKMSMKLDRLLEESRAP